MSSSESSEDGDLEKSDSNFVGTAEQVTDDDQQDKKLCGFPKQLVQVFILMLLMAQNVLMFVVARYSQSAGKGSKPYLKTTVVLSQECLKLCVCCILVITQQGFGSFIVIIRDEILGNFVQTLKVGVPALLYFFQNTLFYVGSANLQAAPFQAVNQFKVVTTALVTVIFFRRCIKALQWGAIGGLMVGLILVVLSNLKDGPLKPDTNPIIGYAATLGICGLSGLAGVYFEYVLKGSDVSIWVRNIQLSLMSITVAICTVVTKDGQKIIEDGFFQGYTKWTVLSITIVAGGGLVVAMVLKYASAILKTFATGSAIVVTGIISSLVPAIDFEPNLMFAGGTLCVVSSIIAYGLAGKKK